MKIYFLTCPSGPPHNNAYHHQSIALAEGLSEIGIQSWGNQDYWRYDYQSNRYAIRKAADHNLNAYDVVVVCSLFYDLGFTHLLPDQLFSTKRNYKLVFIDQSDGIKTPGFRDEVRSADIVLKSHFNRYFVNPANFVPWQFGLTSRIIESVLPKPLHARKSVIYSRFRVQHPVRYLINTILSQGSNISCEKLAFVEPISSAPSNLLEKLYWNQTGRRHHNSFYRRLGSVLACNASGGGTNRILRAPLLEETSFRMRFLRKAERWFPWFPVRSVHQFDSWRFWESLASGCCTFHCDLERYGCTLPVSPVNLEHYIGVDLDSPLNPIVQISNSQQLFEIGEKGRAWALEYYSPRAVASRFLRLLSYV